MSVFICILFFVVVKIAIIKSNILNILKKNSQESDNGSHTVFDCIICTSMFIDFLVKERLLDLILATPMDSIIFLFHSLIKDC